MVSGTGALVMSINHNVDVTVTILQRTLYVKCQKKLLLISIRGQNPWKPNVILF